MKTVLTFFFTLLFFAPCIGQVMIVQGRNVPPENRAEFERRETQYWTKVAQAAIENGAMDAWVLMRNIGPGNEIAPDYLIANFHESFEAQGRTWTQENLSAMGVDPNLVETQSLGEMPMQIFSQVEASIPSSGQLVVVNYAKPTDLGGFIAENKSKWYPYFQNAIEAGDWGLAGWGVASMIYPTGNAMPYSALTWDTFHNMADLMNWLRYQPLEEIEDEALQRIASESSMGEYMPNGFEMRAIYQVVAQLPEPE